MDFPYVCREPSRLPRRPVAPWLLVALIGAVLGAAALGAAITTDTRDFQARHASVPTRYAL